METACCGARSRRRFARGIPRRRPHHMFVDNCAMQLVRNPGQFDVVVTDNLFGDILSDAAAMLTARSACCPRPRSAGRSRPSRRTLRAGPWQRARYRRPGYRQPAGSILSVAMMLRLSLDRPKDADLLERAVEGTVARGGARTADIAGSHAPVTAPSKWVMPCSNCSTASTRKMTTFKQKDNRP